jgi:hypothetical protein
MRYIAPRKPNRLSAKLAAYAWVQVKQKALRLLNTATAQNISPHERGIS